MAHGGDLPNELVLRILARLPVKSLLHFACVCRLWYNTFTYDRNFARAQLQAAREQPSQIHKRLLVSPIICFNNNKAEPPQVHSFHLDTPSFGAREVVNFPININEKVTLLGSCNGLVFVTPFYCCDWVCIWNPSTYRSGKQLPNPEFDVVVKNRSGANDVDWNIFFGAGYVAATDDYKVLIAHLKYEREEAPSQVEVKMFSIRSNAWKTIKPPNAKLRAKEIPATVVSERLHWLHMRDYTEEIIVFDLGKEEFEETMPLPQHDHVKSIIALGVSAGGYLCVVDFPDPFMKKKTFVDDCDSFFDIWVMTEYGVAQSWTMLYRFSYSRLGFCNPVLVTETCTVAAVRKKERQWLRRIDYKNKREQRFGLYTTVQGLRSMLEYEESLLRCDYDDDFDRNVDGINDEDDSMEV